MTKKLTKIDQDALTKLRIAMNAALKTVADDFGIKLSVGSIRYMEQNFTAKVEGAIINTSGEVITKAVSALKDLGELYLGKKFDENKTYNHFSWGDFKVVGIETRKRKFPIVVQVLKSGKRYVVAEDVIRNIVERAA